MIRIVIYQERATQKNEVPASITMMEVGTAALAHCWWRWRPGTTGEVTCPLSEPCVSLPDVSPTDTSVCVPSMNMWKNVRSHNSPRLEPTRLFSRIISKYTYGDRVVGCISHSGRSERASARHGSTDDQRSQNPEGTRGPIPLIETPTQGKTEVRWWTSASCHLRRPWRFGSGSFRAF